MARDVRTEATGAGAGRPPSASGPGGRRPGWRERLELGSMRVPFRVKLAVVWIAIMTALGVFLYFVRFDIPWIRGNARFILLGAPVTMIIALVAILLASTLALIGALGRLSKNPVAFGISGFYISFFRGTPLIVQMFLVHLALPQVAGALYENNWISRGTRELFILQAIQSGTIALGLNYGAYMTEIFRAGIQSVSHGQREAAEALGMTHRQTMQRVVLPQAFRVIIPPTGNEFIAMLKDTALVSFLGAGLGFWMETFRRAQLAGRRDFKPLEALIIAAGMYWALTTVFQFLQSKLERRLSRGYVREVRAAKAAGGAGTGGGAGVAALPDVVAEVAEGAGETEEEPPGG